MPQEMIGQRIAYDTGDPDPAINCQKAGDYCGPVPVGDKTAVFYLLPVARDEGVHPEARSVRHVVSPPHKFFEEPNGTLTIRNSIGAQPHWHGFLTEGRWELNPSK